MSEFTRIMVYPVRGGPDAETKRRFMVPANEAVKRMQMLSLSGFYERITLHDHDGNTWTWPHSDKS